MRYVKIVCDVFAIVEDEEVIAVVTKCNDTQWGVYPSVPCKSVAVASNIPIQNAIQIAIKLERCY